MRHLIRQLFFRLITICDAQLTRSKQCQQRLILHPLAQMPTLPAVLYHSSTTVHHFHRSHEGALVQLLLTKRFNVFLETTKQSVVAFRMVIEGH